MSVLSRYLNRLYITRLFFTALGIAMFALLFDLLEASEELDVTDNAFTALLMYGALRLPSLLSDILPIAALLAALFTASELLRSSELVIMWASGLSVLRIMLLLVPTGLLVCGLKLANDDFAVPHAIETLRSWGVGDYRRAALGADEGFLWVKDGNDVVRLPLFDERDTVEVTNLLIIRLDDEGSLIERLHADRARMAPGLWTLEGVTRNRVGGRAVERVDELAWPNNLPMERVTALARPPQEVGLAGLIDIVRHDGYGVSTTERHRTWLYYRIASAFVPMLMSFLGFALAYRFTRGGGIASLFIRGIAIGFTFLILSGLAIALGEAGFLPPSLAACGPTLLLASVIFTVAWRVSRLRPAGA
ncbi:MAG: LptF/LptG family permease [Geminicoccaceae bacterium]|nr:LptF/LptG family permease [Geminicoccaceae bacterium]